MSCDLLYRGLKPRLMRKEDFMEVVRNDAAVGGWSKEMDWDTAKEAVEDPKFWDMVDDERELHLRGDCARCIYNTMGKKEKKPSVLGVAKGSRMIWYLWLGGRFLEYEALGILNEDHWVARVNLPCGVGGESVIYFGYHLRRLSEKFKYFLADDVAGWDTRLSVADLEDELDFVLGFDMSERQRALINSVYKLLYIIKVALVTRDQRVMLSNVAYDILVRLGQRGSGQIVTYALNTITNAKVQLGRMLENHGIYSQLGPYVNDGGDLSGRNRDMVERIVTMVLNRYAGEWLESMLVDEFERSGKLSKVYK